MVNQSEHCPVCKSARTRHWKDGIDRPLQPIDVRITDASYGMTLPLLRCRDCGFIFAAKHALHNLIDLYAGMEDAEYVAGQESRALQMQWLLSWALRHHPSAKTLLDIGAGAGLIVKEAQALGLQAVGVEPSRYLVKRAREVNGVEILQGTYPHPQIAGKQYDIVMVIDVVEHVGDPIALLTDCAGAVATGGIMAIATPNVSSFAARMLGKRWWHFRIAHVGYFNRHNFERAAQDAGLQIIDRTYARWFFTVRYVAERLAVYLPLGWLVRRARPGTRLGRLAERIVSINPLDSYLFILKHK